MKHLTTLGAFAAIGLLSAPALAQEAMYTNAATMPSPGVFIVRPQLNYNEYGLNPTDGTRSTYEIEAVTSVQYGLARALSLTVEVPAFHETTVATDGSKQTDRGVPAIDLMLKYRFYKNDSGGIDTVRAAVIGGASLPSGDDNESAANSVNPHIGAVVTIVRGRHGFNQELDFKLNTNGEGVDNKSGGEGPADALRFNSAYLYRIIPDRFTSTSTGAWYVTLEMNGLYETNGDTELRWSPGLMFEGRDFAFELMAQFPLYDGVRHRSELDLSLGVGLRFTF
ncbi:MAG: transporter [Phycisphaerales bacterium]